MNRPVNIATPTCHSCWPWVRWYRSGAGAWVRQEMHEPHCRVFPKVQRNDNQPAEKRTT